MGKLLQKGSQRARASPPQNSALTDFIRAQVCSLAQFSHDQGVCPTALLALTREVLGEQISHQYRDGYASAAEGLAQLLTAEGGCVRTDIARALYRQTMLVSRRRIIELIHSGGLIGYPIGKGEYSVPVWQFNPTGGVIAGLQEVIAELKKSETYEEITPFAFLLQGDPLTDGQTPLAALRAGRARAAIFAAANYAG
jgi:hypothetical protein